MKKILTILLCLPLFIFSQEEREYEKIISFSQFAKELKQAADKGESYIIEDYHITYDSIKDQKYAIYHAPTWSNKKQNKYFYGDMEITGLSFKDSTLIISLLEPVC